VHLYQKHNGSVRSPQADIGDLIWPRFFMTMRHIGGLSKQMSAESHPTSRMLALTRHPISGDATPPLPSLEEYFDVSRCDHFQLSNEAVRRGHLRGISAASDTPAACLLALALPASLCTREGAVITRLSGHQTRFAKTANMCE
jgi:hypothetical protein